MMLDQRSGTGLHRPAAPAASNMSMKPTFGRCRRAPSRSGEDTWAAAKRELYEETSVRSVEKLGEVPDWLIYDIPRTVAGRTWKGRYRGHAPEMVACALHGQGQRASTC